MEEGCVSCGWLRASRGSRVSVEARITDGRKANRWENSRMAAQTECGIGIATGGCALVTLQRTLRHFLASTPAVIAE
jgi:hypothetical protein